CQQGYGTPFTF
nr:immunoglobulin light chain junction region [Macaca mulatta]MOX54487.1 immunoglobulin light chain junction region [Macaca mulatta]MOX54836.1 immunoglobulin light chain junction region [Macaca mulatta]MOX55074.1 immunoglobulin light chain junction region [Macaca mulatta]MOX55240.1 immunoglobulin light chain junction region [Macaca mulatta]